MNNVDTVTLLNRLITTSRDGQSALRAAAEEVWHEDLRQSLLEYSQFFGKAADELMDAVRKAGGQPRELGTFDNTLHRTWMHIKAKALGRDEAVILDAVEQDEELADRLYTDAVNWETPPEIHALLERQAQGARDRHRRIREMREQLMH